MNKTTSSIQKIKKLTTAGGVFSGAIGFFNDVLIPLVDFYYYALLAIGLLLIANEIISRSSAAIEKITNLFSKIDNSFDANEYFGRPVTMSLVASGILIVGMSFYSSGAKADGGVLASNFDSFASLQNSLGIIEIRLASIKEDTEVIRSDTAAIKKDTSDILDTMATLKKETSDDPIKELANLGTGYDSWSFGHAIEAGDERRIKLFIKAGFPTDARVPWVMGSNFPIYGFTFSDDKFIQMLLGDRLGLSLPAFYLFDQKSAQRERIGNLLQEHDPEIFQDVIYAVSAIKLLKTDAAAYFYNQLGSEKKEAIRRYLTEALAFMELTHEAISTDSFPCTSITEVLKGMAFTEPHIMKNAIRMCDHARIQNFDIPKRQKLYAVLSQMLKSMT